MHGTRERRARSGGQTLVELLAVVAIVGLAVGAAALYLTPFEAPVESAATQVAGTISAARARAMAMTSSYRVSPASARSLRSEHADSCGAGSWTEDGELALDLPGDVSMPDTGWSVCFNARGISDTNATILLSHADHGTEQVQVLLGGAVRIGP